MTDTGDPAVLILLDFPTGFDTVDHTIVLSRLDNCVGLRGTALKWFQLYLSGSYHAVKLGDSTLFTALLIGGVLQGSILGPILLALYLLPLCLISKKHGISSHFYTGDCQIYLLRKNDSGSLTPLLECLSDVKAWLAHNFLNLNEGLTEIIVLCWHGSRFRPIECVYMHFSIPDMIGFF